MDMDQMKDFAKHIGVENPPRRMKELRAAVLKELEKSGPWAQIAAGVERTVINLLKDTHPA